MGAATAILVSGGVAAADPAQPGATDEVEQDSTADDADTETDDGGDVQPGTTGWADETESGESDSDSESTGTDSDTDGAADAESGAAQNADTDSGESAAEAEATQPGTTEWQTPEDDSQDESTGGQSESGGQGTGDAGDAGTDTTGQTESPAPQEPAEPVETVTPVTAPVTEPQSPAADIGESETTGDTAPATTNGDVTVGEDAEDADQTTTPVADTSGQDDGGQAVSAPDADESAPSGEDVAGDQQPAEEADEAGAEDAAEADAPAPAEPVEDAPEAPAAAVEAPDAAAEQPVAPQAPAVEEPEILSQAAAEAHVGGVSAGADNVTIPNQSVFNARASVGDFTVEAPTLAVGQVEGGVAEVGVGTDTPEPITLPDPVAGATEVVNTAGKHAADAVPAPVRDAVPESGDHSIGADVAGARVAWDGQGQ